MGTLDKTTKRELLEVILNLVPIGKVVTYSDLANILNTHPRAIAKMLASNEKLIVVPCHRVVPKDLDVGGYKLGREFKKRLLELEGVRFCKMKICNESLIKLSDILL
ncbi:methylated-DNA-protein-cysteine methyltransferase [Ignicoccus islandicus DSM 13165]|uniref:Methylated-DNA-protein-cysteine methyltransferase n=1 Tax=Ignicoccus islandicus DSM 13165 TaxID=940295 RepID=A0A0U3G185_9CREN|nr:MGMT family protein [Ignicoccus islandicus]ALU12076.1 methylated-DNA-protein-cysteine methyltransferase [Ignicoccus islandicus DSM 13165]